MLDSEDTNSLLGLEELLDVVDDDGGLLGVEVGRTPILSLVFAVDAVEDDRAALLRQVLPLGWIFENFLLAEKFVDKVSRRNVRQIRV
jgi:hypothetical protein